MKPKGRRLEHISFTTFAGTRWVEPNQLRRSPATSASVPGFDIPVAARSGRVHKRVGAMFYNYENGNLMRR